MPDWHHAPIHHFDEGYGTFFITGATYEKQHIYRTPPALDALRELLFKTATTWNCALQAWALLSNHYHLVVEAEDGPLLRKMLSSFHAHAALHANERDDTPGRKVWYQFWDKTLTIEGSWLARLRYTNENAVHHGMVTVATDYRWCSARWFEETAGRPIVSAVSRVKIDKVKIYDPF